MDRCIGCGRTVPLHFGNTWCQRCGGFVSKPGFLLLREVAAVRNPHDVIILMFDASLGQYSFRCNRVNPRWIAYAKGEHVDGIDDEFVPTPVLSKWGTLEEVIRFLKAELGGGIVFEPGVHSTQDERNILQEA